MRLVRLEQGQADEDTVRYCFESEEPALQEAAARHCASRDAGACADLQQLATDDHAPHVRRAALESMAERCRLTDRRDLVAHVESTSGEYLSLLSKCRSADGMYALISSQAGLHEEVEASLERPLRLRDWQAADESEKYAWLRAAMELLPEPRVKVLATAESLRPDALRIRRGKAALQRSEHALQQGDLDAAEALLAKAESAAVFDAQLRKRLQRAKELALAARRERVATLLQDRQNTELQWLTEDASSRLAHLLTDETRVRSPPHPELGSFPKWAATRSGRRAMKKLGQAWKAVDSLRELTARYEKEKAVNDAAEVPPSVWMQPLYPEVSGAFTFVKILSRWEGEALFGATDGFFVLRLEGGDSFTAFPGQLVNMTMHNRGETVVMTNGTRLPVFVSGSSPGVPRRSRGVKPNRTKERKLARQVKAASRRIKRLTSRMERGNEDDDLSDFRLVGARPFVVELRASDAWEIVGVLMRHGDAVVLCMGRDSTDCPDGAREYVALSEVAPDFDGPFQPASLSVKRSSLLAVDEGAPHPRRAPWAVPAQLTAEPEPQLGISSPVQLRCKVADPMFPEFEGQMVSNSWFAETVCGVGVSDEFPGLKSLRIVSNESVEVRCASPGGDWGTPKDAAFGCSSADGIGAIEIEPLGERDVRLELLCSRDGHEFSECKTPSAEPVRAVVLLQTRRLFDEADDPEVGQHAEDAEDD